MIAQSSHLVVVKFYRRRNHPLMIVWMMRFFLQVNAAYFLVAGSGEADFNGV